MNTVQTSNERSGERGNVLFLILIAVALFAALSYAVTQSTRSGAGSSDSETGLINSAQLTQYPAGVRTAVVRMIIGGVEVGNLSFNPPSDFTNITNNLSWHVFHPTGGGATFATAPGDVMASGAPARWYFNARNQINLIGTTDGTGSPTQATADIIAFLPGINQSICNRINQELGINGVPTESGIKYAISENMESKSNGADSPTSPSWPLDGGTIGGSGAEVLDGQPFGCFRNGTAEYVYYHVLVER